MHYCFTTGPLERGTMRRGLSIHSGSNSQASRFGPIQRRIRSCAGARTFYILVITIHQRAHRTQLLGTSGSGLCPIDVDFECGLS